MERAVVHIDVPDFYSVVEETRDPALRRRALAFAVPGPRAVVQAVSDNARKEGIAEGMPLAVAQRICRRLL
ncbi:MAG: DNA polymerase IV, partial [Acidobacteriota bacterium]